MGARICDIKIQINNIDTCYESTMKAQLEVHLEVKLVFRGTFIIAQFAFRICDFISLPD